MARVLVTRAAHQASALGDALVAQGLRVVAIPTIELAPPSDDYASLDAELARLDKFDWLLFTSANAVSVFAERLEGEAVPLTCRIASIGAATSTALKAHEIRVDLQPPQAFAESLAQALVPHARGASILLVRAEQGRDVLPQTLREAGAEVVLAAAYSNVVPSLSAARLQREMPTVDAITLTSSSAVHHLFALFQASGLELNRDVVLASIGPVTSATLREYGYAPAVEAAEASTAALASAVATALRGVR